ncbi:Glutaredoxin-like domain protein [[Clostridium] ultunense Esp]|uniref:protein disulfide oxidoreductase n=1 Tax=Thermicanus aegyptius TaxID=94009 RepID=UPI0002B6FEDF|nr:thioredoxin family protein [Thermicanus aegyptius]CCQ96189.1 Glutaredoxin-like domain protein [[Clostridium] ultunense Esp]
MGIIAEKDKGTIREMFEKMNGTTHILFFHSQLENAEYGNVTKQILEELAELTDRLKVTAWDREEHQEEAKKYGVDKAPAILFVKEDGTDTGVRFYGIPSGYEFTTLIEDIIDISNGTTGLSAKTVEALQGLDKDVHLQVFVTPTCPYCPRAVRVAHFMAMVHPKIKADMVEATEFPELSNRYSVYGVPKTVINDGAEEQEGAVPEQVILQKILAVVQ